MLDQLDAQSPDALLALIKMHAQDPREDKIDLGVGVYRTNDGATPVFRAIKAAEQKLVDTQDSKSYLGPEGDTGFVDALKPYIFGKDAAMGGRLEGMQTPGGTGAVRLAVALSKAAGVQRVYLGTPSWPNHAQILEDVGVETGTFRHAAPDGTADIDALLDVIANARASDAVL
ncbi:MAG TPA: aromatic amino acid aminotransferase, partial [Erythrobacter sp.]|nr:aromatic amino acid aminotransferase [Erythrobacter sp.]